MVSEVVASFRRAKAKGLARHFYSRFLAEDDEIRKRFAQTDFARQEELFEHGVQMLLKFGAGEELGQLAIERLGRMHAHDQLDVPPRMYSTWLKCLILTLNDVDPEFDPVLAELWVEAIEPGLEKMASMHRG